ncbi:MAG: tellurite resistance/C4-dicarboxylate transporter family protein [Deltaproteobacteria bacterium]|nr:tellurite resistance/C4-dicarboxylate transporter family protein [Deltaproteobacteria bacterium]
MIRWLDARIAELAPRHFALVMATGIVSIAAWLEGLEGLARVLLGFNLLAYGVLVALTIARAARHRARLVADALDHRRAPDFFTLVAGTGVLGTQLLTIRSDPTLPWILWITAAVLWVAITYGFFTVVTIKQDKPPIETGLSGSWLLVVVATQSLAVLGPLLAQGQEPGRERDAILLTCLSLFFVGCLLYGVLITLILYRFIFFPFTSVQLAPPYWINMGAVAITTVAASSLLGAAALSPLLAELVPVLRGLAIAFWATASWWIPLLVLLGIWRHGHGRVRITYDPQYWGLVFPLGMYTTATVRLSHALELPFLLVISRGFVFVAIAAWTLTLLGLGRALLRTRA